MHSLVRTYLKTAIAFLVVGLLLGAIMLVQREVGRGYLSPYLVSAHTHAIFVGFVMLMIQGVALWMFPRPAPDDTRYRPAVARAAYWLVTAGTALRVVGELLRMVETAHWLRWAVVVAGVTQVAGVLAFFFTMWTRIRPVGSQRREALGERF